MHGSTTVSRGASRQMVQSRASSRSLTRSCRSEHRCVSSPACACRDASEARSRRSSSGEQDLPDELVLDPPSAALPPRPCRWIPTARSIAAKFDSVAPCALRYGAS
eukprot:scaffold43527_cov55-Phaeocystis_antarctica.AAC.4